MKGHSFFWWETNKLLCRVKYKILSLCIIDLVQSYICFVGILSAIDIQRKAAVFCGKCNRVVRIHNNSPYLCHRIVGFVLLYIGTYDSLVAFHIKGWFCIVCTCIDNIFTCTYRFEIKFLGFGTIYIRSPFCFRKVYTVYLNFGYHISFFIPFWDDLEFNIIIFDGIIPRNTSQVSLWLENKVAPFYYGNKGFSKGWFRVINFNSDFKINLSKWAEHSLFLK